MNMLFNNTLKRHHKAIADLEDDVRRLQSSHKAMELEWADTLDRVNRSINRLGTTARRLEAAEDRAGGTNGEQPDPRVPPELDPVSAKIWARRMNAVPRHE